MKVALNWLKNLVNYEGSVDELVTLFNHKTIGSKEVTEEFIELDMKGYNRADLLSLRGVAYEVSAITDSNVLFMEPSDVDYLWIEQGLPATRVEIVEEDLAQVQSVAKIEGIKVGKSPQEWIQKLNDSGMRSVNNIVDITNLIMLEFGYPLHAFDAKNVKDDTILVRRAEKNEEITTLDGKKRLLESSDIVLADDEKALDVAGVMGGQETEVTETTDTILLSASLFNPEMIRKTANRLGLHSEASKRFYHGSTRTRLLQALDAAIRMFESAGGKLTALTIVGDTVEQLKVVPLRLTKVNKLVGESLTEDQVENYLKRLNFTLSDKVIKNDLASWVVTVPYFRLDIELEEDLIEEIARMYGYEKIKAQKASDQLVAKIDQTKFNFLRKLGEKAVELGLTEVSTYPYSSIRVLEALGWRDSVPEILVKIKNPISAETEFLRQSIWPNLVEVIDKDARQGFKDMAIFEIGKTYSVKKNGELTEEYRLSLALLNDSENPLAEINAIFDKLNEELNLGLEVKQAEDEFVKYFAHPVRFMQILKDGEAIGGMGEVHKRTTDSFGIEKRVAVFEVELSTYI